MEIISVKDLHVHFEIYEGTSRVINGVTMSVERGEKVGLAGETGCGKTVMMKSILGSLPSPAGRIAGGFIHYKGQDITDLKGKAARRERLGMSFVPQNPMNSLNPVFTIGEQLLTVRKYSRMAPQMETRHRRRDVVRSLLAAVQLPDTHRIMSSYPVQLSGGMRQRVLMAMALAPEPEFLIADEPGTALDVTIQAQILNLLTKLVDRQRLTVLLITHNLGVMRTLTERLYIMYAGNIVEYGPTQDVLLNPLHPYTVGLIRSVPRLRARGMEGGIPGHIPDYLSPPAGCRFSPRCVYALEKCRYVLPDPVELRPRHYVSCHRSGGGGEGQ